MSANNKGYLITAKHVLGDVKNKQLIDFSIIHTKTVYNLKGSVLLHSNQAIDIALISFDDSAKGIPLEPEHPTFGDQGFFLGFPLGLKTFSDRDTGFGRGFPIPLIKKCTFSGVISEDGVTTYFLDGHNNPGFSGGPVLFKNRNKLGDTDFHLLGVISAYINQRNQVVTPSGTVDYAENSGIIIVYAASHISEILTQNGN